LRKLEFAGATTLKGIEDHRLQALVLRDLEIYKRATVREIHRRIGSEISLLKLQKVLRKLADSGEIGKEGVRRGTVYFSTK
jgi:hypothetical protein